MSAVPSAADEAKAWRSALRKELIARREAARTAERERWSRQIAAYIDRLVPDARGRVVGFCWPYKSEHDARPIVLRMLAQGARAALPVVVAPRTPLAFREWSPGCAMEDGAHGIPVPAESAPQATPDLVLLPMNGFDREGYRLGYGSGFFDRTLASLERRPVVIGICFELGRVETIHPQPHDIPMDYVVTEAGAWKRGDRGLEPASGLGKHEDRGHG